MMMMMMTDKKIVSISKGLELFYFIVVIHSARFTFSIP